MMTEDQFNALAAAIAATNNLPLEVAEELAILAGDTPRGAQTETMVNGVTYRWIYPMGEDDDE